VLLALTLLWPAVMLVRSLMDLVAADRARIAAAHAQGDTATDFGRLRAVQNRQQVRLRGFVQEMAWSLDHASPELLSAQLQRMIETAAARDGASVTSSRTVTVQTENTLSRIGLDLDILSSLPALQSLLHDVQAARPAILIDRLTVQLPESGSITTGADGRDQFGVALRLSIYAVDARGL
jgi:hypothetical protein